MKKTLDVKYINPFLQSTLSVFQTITQTNLSVGKPVLTDLNFNQETFVVQTGLTGNIKGQMLMVLSEQKAKLIASNMMGGITIENLDDIACSALSELSNMIMGNTATIFSTLDILIDITPPISLFGSNLKFQSDIQALKIPLLNGTIEEFSLYLYLTKE